MKDIFLGVIDDVVLNFYLNLNLITFINILGIWSLFIIKYIKYITKCEFDVGLKVKMC